MKNVGQNMRDRVKMSTRQYTKTFCLEAIGSHLPCFTLVWTVPEVSTHVPTDMSVKFMTWVPRFKFRLNKESQTVSGKFSFSEVSKLLTRSFVVLTDWRVIVVGDYNKA